MPASDVFISYNSRDQAAVAELVQRLQKAGVATWMSSRELKGGEDWRMATRSAKGQRNVWMLVAGPHGIGPAQADEIEEAGLRLEKEPGRFRAIPVLLPGVDPLESKQLPELFHKLYRVEFRTLDDREAMDRLLKALHDDQAAPAADTSSIELHNLASSRRRMALLAVRLLLRTREAMNLVKAPDAAALHEALRGGNVTTITSVLELETALARETEFNPNPLWLAWIENVQGAKLDFIGRELLTLPAQATSTPAPTPNALPPTRSANKLNPLTAANTPFKQAPVAWKK